MNAAHLEKLDLFMKEARHHLYPEMVKKQEFHSEQEYMHEMKIVWDDLQKDPVSKFAHSRHLVADKSDHMIPFYQPEVIIQAVNEMVYKHFIQKRQWVNDENIYEFSDE
jgi:hypothetical protein